MKFAGVQATGFPLVQESEIDQSTVLNMANRKMKRVESIHNPLKIKVLNLAANNLTSINDIQLWYAILDQPPSRVPPPFQQQARID
jgi:hypothetical protein